MGSLFHWELAEFPSNLLSSLAVQTYTNFEFSDKNSYFEATLEFVKIADILKQNFRLSGWIWRHSIVFTTSINEPLTSVQEAYFSKSYSNSCLVYLQNLVSVPAFGELTPVQRKPTIRTIHNLHQFQEHTNAVEDAVDEDFESKLFQLETETVNDHDIL